MTSIQSIVIRDATEADLLSCVHLDLSYETDYVWQLDVRDDTGAIAMSFRTVRLPRMMRVVLPREEPALSDGLHAPGSLFVAEMAGVVRGFLQMRLDNAHSTAWITDIGVGRAWRRQGIGTALLAQAYTTAQSAGVRRLSVETQSKNYPGICFCQKHGFVFCGFNDRYYPNNDIALFFSQTVH